MFAFDFSTMNFLKPFDGALAITDTAIDKAADRGPGNITGVDIFFNIKPKSQGPGAAYSASVDERLGGDPSRPRRVFRGTSPNEVAVGTLSVGRPRQDRYGCKFASPRTSTSSSPTGYRPSQRISSAVSGPTST